MKAVRGRRGAFLLATSLWGCLVDPSSPCGSLLQRDADGACVCPEGFAPNGGGCTPVESPDDSAEASDCELGAACPCASSQDCPTGELCDVHGSSKCVAAPTGLGAPCSSASSCAGTEATFCDTFVSRTCQVQGCADRAGVCPGDLLCCDYAILSISLCVPTDTAMGGCPAPGQLVMRSGSP